jgi:outer membrane protein OmpA-like peptidoglycan-associated protein
MENIAIYYHTESRSFGEYDFAKEQYKFKPFNNFSTEKRLSYTWSDYEKYFRTNLKFFGLDFVDGIPMEKTQAEQFLNRKQQNNIWGQSYNNRTVYLKIYYNTSVEDKVEKSYEYKAYDENKLKCTPLLVQAFGDKNFNEFVCEWWNPNITSYYKQQLINNNVPRGFYESLNQPAEEASATDVASVSSYDRDGDGIINEKDNCPDVPGMISTQGCPDRDGDGVKDDADKCPDVAGAASNKGCPVVKEEVKKTVAFAARNIQFETNSAVIKPVSYKTLDELAAILNEYRYYDVNIDGHCDHIEGVSNSFGTPLNLSQARAAAAAEYLKSKGVSADRLITSGYGYDKPIADDFTSAGRAQNRRVEFNLIFKNNGSEQQASNEETKVQSRQLDVWKSLYPGNTNFNNEKKLVRKIQRDGYDVELRTEIGKTFYYKINDQQKAIVILFSYSYTDGVNKDDCHACRPEFEVATFSNIFGNWMTQRFVENWSEASGSWGKADEVTFEKYNNVNCIKISGSYGNQGTFISYTNYYDIETLKKIKSIEKNEN